MGGNSISTHSWVLSPAGLGPSNSTLQRVICEPVHYVPPVYNFFAQSLAGTKVQQSPQTDFFLVKPVFAAASVRW